MQWHNLGETDKFGVSDHVNILEKYLGKDTINSVIVSNTKLPKAILEKYELLEDDLLTTEDGKIKHDSLKLSSIIFSYLMRKN